MSGVPDVLRRVASAESPADDLRFTSPQDDGIHKAASFERCFTTDQRPRLQHVIELGDVGSEGVFPLSSTSSPVGGTYRNAYLITVRDGVFVPEQVFFGGRGR